MKSLPLDDAMEARMQRIRGDIDHDLEGLAASAGSMVDWKHYVKAYPWVCLGTAVTVGFMMIRKRATARRPGLAALTDLAETGHRVLKPALAATRGLADALLAAVATLAVQKTTAYFGHRAEQTAGVTAHFQDRS